MHVNASNSGIGTALRLIFFQFKEGVEKQANKAICMRDRNVFPYTVLI